MLSDETLTLFYYGDELEDSERFAVERALASDDALARRYAVLAAELGLLRGTAPPEAPPEALRRWRYELDRVATPPRRTMSWLVFGTAAAAMFFGIVIGLRIGLDTPEATSEPVLAVTPPPALSNEPPADNHDSRTFARGLVSYMQVSQEQLANLPEADAGERIDLLTRIRDRNRAFERVAEQRGAQDIARVLRAFEQVLLSLATQPAAPGDVADEAAKLSFEYAAMLTRLTQQASKEPYQL